MPGLKRSLFVQRARQNFQLKDTRFTSAQICDAATYIGFLIFVLALPFGYSTAFLNIGLSFVLFGWVGRIIVGTRSPRSYNWQRTPLDIPILLFLGLGVIASLLAPHPATSSLGYFWKHLRAILLFYAVIHSRLGTRWRHIVIAFIVAAGLSSALGLYYYANDTRLAMDFMGRIGLQFQEELAAGEGTNLQMSDELRAELRNCNVPLSQTATFVTPKQPDEWRIDDPARNRRYTVRKGETHLMVYMIEQRLTGTFKMPNDLGAYLALTLPYVMGYFVAGCSCLIFHAGRTEAHGKSQRFSIGVIVGVGVVLALMGANLALTLTRAAWVSVAVAVVCIGGYCGVKTLFKRVSWKRSLLGVTFISVVFCVLIVNGKIIGVVPRHIKERIETMIVHPAGFMGERPQWWRTSLELIQKYPLTGIGLGRFRYEYQHNGPEEQYYIPYHAHNIYLHIATEQGIPSLFLFLWMLTIMCQQVFLMRKTNDFWQLGTFIGARGFLISALVYGLADNILHQRTVLLFYFILGIIFYTQLSQDKKHETSEPD
ncbi:O-antigen ligase family protein [Candidatus Poribacteria bacterium]|nr:O-antigen ligase family protein [Candidatus Poribacteria bacterium]MYA56713.1 O-antigen ligase family protein [Candidatus Poribacteria bacterium]